MMYRTVDFHYPVFGKSGFLELPVDVRGDDEKSVFAPVRPAKEQLESVVRNGFPVQAKPVSVEPPRERKITAEPCGIRKIGKTQALDFVGRIGVPEPSISAKIGQPRVDPHPCPGGDQNRFRLPNCFDGKLGLRAAAHMGNVRMRRHRVKLTGKMRRNDDLDRSLVRKT